MARMTVALTLTIYTAYQTLRRLAELNIGTDKLASSQKLIFPFWEKYSIDKHFLESIEFSHLKVGTCS